MKAKLIAIALAGLLGAGTIGTASAIEGTGGRFGKRKFLYVKHII